MEDFFKKLGGDKKRTNKHKTGGGIKNPFANLNVGGGTKKFSGQGQSLGGSKPGKVIKVSLQNHGSLGIKVCSCFLSSLTAFCYDFIYSSCYIFCCVS